MGKNNKAFQFRIYPPEEQKELFAKTFGCCRFIYNRMLSDKIEEFMLVFGLKIEPPGRRG